MSSFLLLDTDGSQVFHNCRQLRSHGAQEDRDSQNDSENIDCTPQSNRAPAHRSRPSPTQPQPAEALPQEPAEEQDGTAACGPGSPAWQVDNTCVPDNSATQQGFGHHVMLLHYSAPFGGAQL